MKGLTVDDDVDDGGRMDNDISDKEDGVEAVSSVEKLRAGIKASLSVIEQYKARWPQVGYGHATSSCVLVGWVGYGIRFIFEVYREYMDPLPSFHSSERLVVILMN